VFNLLQADEAL
jgi:hypothetical protein